MNYMGEASYELGVKITRDHSQRFLSLSLHNKSIPQLSIGMCTKTEEENEKMARVPFVIGIFDKPGEQSRGF